MNVRLLLKDITPPGLLRLRQRLRGGTLRFTGRPADWKDACRMSEGYDAAGILDRVIRASRTVHAGGAAYERDGVLFHEIDYPFAILSCLMRAAALDGGRLDVVDFGGSLGSTYRQCRPFLQGLASTRWHVVEQPSFAAAGRAEFSTPELQFVSSLAELPQAGAQRVALLSSVLQYLEDPAGTLGALLSSAGVRHLVIDRTPLSAEDSDRLCIQHVPKQIYPASYPCWILSRPRLLEGLSSGWRTVCEFPCPEGAARTEDGLPFEFRGLILERKT